MKTALAILVALLAGILLERMADAAPRDEKTQQQQSAAPGSPLGEHARAPTEAARSPAALREVRNAASGASSARPAARSVPHAPPQVRAPDAPHLARLNRPAAGVGAPGRYGTQLPTNGATAIKQRPPGLAMLGGPARLTRPPREPASPYAPRH